MAIGDICCDAVDYRGAVQQIDDFVRSGRPHLVLTPNIAQVRQASKLPEVAEAYRSASMSTRTAGRSRRRCACSRTGAGRAA